MEEFIDVTPEDLEQLINACEAQARRRSIGEVFASHRVTPGEPHVGTASRRSLAGDSARSSARQSHTHSTLRPDWRKAC